MWFIESDNKDSFPMFNRYDKFTNDERGDINTYLLKTKLI
jgi:hypothetical protein